LLVDWLILQEYHPWRIGFSVIMILFVFMVIIVVITANLNGALGLGCAVI